MSLLEDASQDKLPIPVHGHSYHSCLTSLEHQEISITSRPEKPGRYIEVLKMAGKKTKPGARIVKR